MLGWLVRWLGRPLELRGPVQGPWDVIVVLGSPLRADGSLSSVVEERLVVSLELWKAGRAPRICVSGGRTRGARVAEAEAMASWLRDRGVPDAELVVEADSGSTGDNARKIAKLLGNCRVLVVSQPFHLRRARRWFRRCGLAADAHWIESSMQYDEPRLALRWIAREYGAWVVDSFRRGRRES